MLAWTSLNLFVRLFHVPFIPTGVSPWLGHHLQAQWHVEQWSNVSFSAKVPHHPPTLHDANCIPATGKCKKRIPSSLGGGELWNIVCQQRWWILSKEKLNLQLLWLKLQSTTWSELLSELNIYLAIMSPSLILLVGYFGVARPGVVYYYTYAYIHVCFWHDGELADRSCPSATIGIILVE